MSIVVILAFLSLSASVSQAETFDEFLHRAETASAGERQALADSFMSQIAATPLVENDTLAHFLYLGPAASLNVPGDFNGWNRAASPMSRLDGTDLWHLSHAFEDDARLDYKFILNGSNWILDPRNPNTCTGGFGPNSELGMPDYVPSPEIEYYPEIPHGTLQDTSFSSKHLDNTRTIRIYLPPGYETSTDRYAMILFHDGLEYISLANADNILDYLIHYGRIEPVIAVFVPPIDRHAEYVGDLRNRFTCFIVDEIIPWVDGRFRTDPRPNRRAVMGASNGGDISLWLGVSHPQIFGHIGAQSTTITSDIFDQFRNGPGLDLRLSLDLGTYDIPGIIPLVRSFIPVLKEKGYRFRYGEYPEGHSWGLWRAHIDDALELFFPAEMISTEEGEYGTVELRAMLSSGTPDQKEEVLDIFMRHRLAALVPDVITAVLDTTISPRHMDTGWGRIYHQAAWAMVGFAEKIDGISLEQRGRKEYSFYDDVGTASLARRQDVHGNWKRWWQRIEDRIRQAQERPE